MPGVLDIADAMIGQREGQSAVGDYLRTGGQNLDPATRAWCAAFVNATLSKAGLPGTGSNMARSFLNYGTPIEAASLRPGDIAVFPRGAPGAGLGHVGFVQSYDPSSGMINLLAGNQGNAVSVRPYAAANALGFRRPGEGQGDVSGAALPFDPFGNRVEASGVFDVPIGQPQPQPPMTPERFMGQVIAGQNPLRTMVYNQIMGMLS
jgi:uncharacterized protein (TIGR02594 family)